MKVAFYDDAEDKLFKYAVIVSEYRGKWVFCKHKERDTLEIPGGHREHNESILQTAKRELYEETGAVSYTIQPVCAYSVKDTEETFGMLYYAVIDKLSDLPPFEIERIELFDRQPERLTYPYIQPRLFYRARKAIKKPAFSCVLWDWNGTLVDDADVALDSVNDMLIKRNMSPIDKEFYLRNCSTPIINFYRKIFDLEKVDYEDLLKEFNDGYHLHINDSGLMKGALSVLKRLKEQGITQVIVSSSAQKEILTFMNRFEVEGYFSAVLGAEDYYAESKLQRAVCFLTENNIAPQNVVVIGDTLHDHEIAKALNSECFLISNGHQCKDDLLQSGNMVLDDISEVSLYI